MGAGKSTIVIGLAARLGFTSIDTGAMYRAVALWAVRQDVDPGNIGAAARNGWDFDKVRK